MAFIHRLPICFEDVDYARVVHFPRFFSLCHRAFEAFVPAEMGASFAEMIEKRGIGFPVVHAEADFKKPFRLSEECRVEVEAKEVKDRSFTMRYRLYRAGETELRAEIHLINAVVSVVEFKSMAMPTEVRAALERHRAG